MDRSQLATMVVTISIATAIAGAWPLLQIISSEQSRPDGSYTPGGQDEGQWNRGVDLPEGKPSYMDNPSTNDSLLYGPTTIEDTNILFNLTNHSDKDLELKVAFSREGELPMAFEARGAFYDRTNEYITQFGRSLVFADTAFSARYEDFSFNVPFSIFEPQTDYSDSKKLRIPPGSHYLVVAVYDVDMQMSVESYGEQEALTLDIIQEGPGMDQLHWIQIEGHWDQVAKEVTVGNRVGLIEGSLRVDLTETYRYIMITSLGDYNELSVMDSDGDECHSEGDAYTSPAMFLWAMPSKGEVLVEGKNIGGRGAPIIVARIIDLPIEFPQSMDGCWTHDDPPFAHR